MLPESLGVIGVGAIGGSIAWHAVRAGVSHVFGYAVPPADAVAAARAGAITEVVTSPQRVVERAEFVVLAAPPRTTIELLESLTPQLKERGCLVTDVSSVKGAIVSRAEALGLGEAFAGSHPFAGTHESGFGAARPDLFPDRVVYVTPTRLGERAAGEVADFWERVAGAHVVRIDAARHDALLAWTSHLPQVTSSALAVALAETLPAGANIGTGARSTTRLAASSVAMWTDILLLNREQVLDALDTMGGSVDRLREALRSEDATAVAAWLEAGRAWRTKLGD